METIKFLGPEWDAPPRRFGYIHYNIQFKPFLNGCKNWVYRLNSKFGGSSLTGLARLDAESKNDSVQKVKDYVTKLK